MPMPSGNSNDADDDESFIKAVQDGHKEAFIKIYNVTFNTLHNLVLNVIKDVEAAEDIIAECYHSLYYKRKYLISMQVIRRTLFVDARERCLEYFRKRKSTSPAKQNIDLDQVFGLN
jgi:DNA-directed RNA polymerase specialized sigma24 family protein